MCCPPRHLCHTAHPSLRNSRASTHSIRCACAQGSGFSPSYKSVLAVFSLKDVLYPLVPDLSYSDLVIVDGLVASVEIARLLFVVGRF